MTKFNLVEPIKPMENVPTPLEISTTLRYILTILDNHRWGSATELSHIYRLIGNLEKTHYIIYPPEKKTKTLTMATPANIDMQAEAYEVLKGLMVPSVVKLQDSK